MATTPRRSLRDRIRAMFSRRRRLRPVGPCLDDHPGESKQRIEQPDESLNPTSVSNPVSCILKTVQEQNLGKQQLSHNETSNLQKPCSVTSFYPHTSNTTSQPEILHCSSISPQNVNYHIGKDVVCDNDSTSYERNRELPIGSLPNLKSYTGASTSLMTVTECSVKGPDFDRRSCILQGGSKQINMRSSELTGAMKSHKEYQMISVENSKKGIHTESCGIVAGLEICNTAATGDKEIEASFIRETTETGVKDESTQINTDANVKVIICDKDVNLCLGDVFKNVIVFSNDCVEVNNVFRDDSVGVNNVFSNASVGVNNEDSQQRKVSVKIVKKGIAKLESQEISERRQEQPRDRQKNVFVNNGMDEAQLKYVDGKNSVGKSNIDTADKSLVEAEPASVSCGAEHIEQTSYREYAATIGNDEDEKKNVLTSTLDNDEDEKKYVLTNTLDNDEDEKKYVLTNTLDNDEDEKKNVLTKTEENKQTESPCCPTSASYTSSEKPRDTQGITESTSHQGKTEERVDDQVEMKIQQTINECTSLRDVAIDDSCQQLVIPVMNCCIKVAPGEGCSSYNFDDSSDETETDNPISEDCNKDGFGEGEGQCEGCKGQGTRTPEDCCLDANLVLVCGHERNCTEDFRSSDHENKELHVVQAELPSCEDNADTTPVSITLVNRERNYLVDEYGLVDAYRLIQNEHDSRSLGQRHYNTQSRLRNYLEELTREMQESRRQLHDVNRKVSALKREAVELRCALTAVCDSSVAAIGEHDVKNLEPMCFKRYSNIRTATDASKALAYVRNQIKALSDLEVLIYRKQLVLLQVFPNVNQDETPPPKRVNRTAHKTVKSRRAEQTITDSTSIGNIVIEIVSPVPELNSWSKEISQTESPVTISTLMSISNEGTASTQHLTDTEV